MEDDAVLDALDELVRALESNAQRIGATIERARTIRRQREAGLSYSEIESGPQRPLIVELTRESPNYYEQPTIPMQ